MPGKTIVVLKPASAKTRQAPQAAGANVPRDIRSRLELRFQAERFVRWRERRR
jgi:hypothetical protein